MDWLQAGYCLPFIENRRMKKINNFSFFFFGECFRRQIRKDPFRRWTDARGLYRKTIQRC